MFIREKRRRGGEKMNKKCVWKCWTNEGGDPCAVLDVCALGGRENYTGSPSSKDNGEKRRWSEQWIFFAGN